MFAGIGITLIVSSQLTGKLVDYIHTQTLLRLLTCIQIIGVCIVSLTLIQHASFIFSDWFYNISSSSYSGVATLGFLLRWRKVPLVMVVLQVY